MTREDKLSYIFKHNAELKELYVTSDEQAFPVQADAKNHANTLKDKDVQLVHRRDILKKVLNPETPGKDAETPVKPKAGTKGKAKSDAKDNADAGDNADQPGAASQENRTGSDTKETE